MSEPTWEQELIVARWGSDLTLHEIIEESERRNDLLQGYLEEAHARGKARRAQLDATTETLERTEALLADMARSLPDAELVARLRGDEPE